MEVDEEPSVKEIKKLETPKKESIVEITGLPAAEMKESKILNEFPTPEGEAPETPKRVSVTREREHPLSLSEIQIAEMVGKEV
jgi:hypothetical protein